MSPPHYSDVVGRQPTEQHPIQHNICTLLSIYHEENKKCLCDKSRQKISNNVYVSLFSRLSLCDYVTARTIFCETTHKRVFYSTCTPLLNVAKHVIADGHVQLSVAFKLAYPAQKYKTDIALSRLLRMPLACIKPHQQNVWFLVEFVIGVDYVKFVSLTDALCSANTDVSKSPSISKSDIKSIMTLAQSDRERELIRYSVFKASGMSYTSARRTFGFQDMQRRETTISNAMKAICEAIDDLAPPQTYHCSHLWG